MNEQRTVTWLGAILLMVALAACGRRADAPAPAVKASTTTVVPAQPAADPGKSLPLKSQRFVISDYAVSTPEGAGAGARPHGPALSPPTSRAPDSASPAPAAPADPRRPPRAPASGKSTSVR